MSGRAPAQGRSLVREHMYTHTCILLYVCLCTHVYFCILVYTGVRMYTSVYSCILVYTCILLYTPVYLCTHVYFCILMYTYAYFCVVLGCLPPFALTPTANNATYMSSAIHQTIEYMIAKEQQMKFFLQVPHLDVKVTKIS